HGDALVPAQPAGREVGGLGEVEAPRHGDSGHAERQHQGLVADGVDHRLPAADQHERDHEDDRTLGDDRQEGEEEGNRVGRHEEAGGSHHHASPISRSPVCTTITELKSPTNEVGGPASSSTSATSSSASSAATA